MNSEYQNKYSLKEITNGIPQIKKYINVKKVNNDFIKVINGQPFKIAFIENHKDLVTNVYETPGSAACFRGSLAIFNHLKKNYIGISRRDILNVLDNIENNQVFKVANKPKITRPVLVKGPLKIWSADLVFINNNQGERLFTLLTVIDNFSKFAWTQIVKTEDKQKYTAQSVYEAFKKIFNKEQPHLPSVLKTDNGTEFKNHKVLDYLEQLNIKPIYTRSHTPTDNAISERFNRTIKVMLGKYLNSVNGEIIDNESLQKLVNSYNQTVHNSTNQRPIDIHPGKTQLKSKVVDQLQSQVYDKNYDRAKTILADNYIIQPRISKGDSVRLHKRTQAKFRQERGLKAKVYLPQWSYEIYKVATVSKPNQTHNEQYEIYDINGNLIPNKFTRNDLLKVNKKEIITEMPDGHYVVKSILKSKGIGQNKKYLVNWQGWPNDVTNWVKPNKSFQKLINEYES